MRSALAWQIPVLALAVSMASPAQARPPALTEYQVKAGFIFNFARLIEWPKRGSAAILPVCLVGDGALHEAGIAIAGKDVNGRRIEVRDLAAPDEVGGCDIVVVASSRDAELPALIAAIGPRPILTIGDAQGFAARGLVIDFYREGEEVRFSVNVDAARRAGFKLSAGLLNLARIVRDGEAP